MKDYMHISLTDSWSWLFLFLAVKKEKQIKISKVNDKCKWVSKSINK